MNAISARSDPRSTAKRKYQWGISLCDLYRTFVVVVHALNDSAPYVAQFEKLPAAFSKKDFGERNSLFRVRAS